MNMYSNQMVTDPLSNLDATLKSLKLNFFYLTIIDYYKTDYKKILKGSGILPLRGYYVAIIGTPPSETLIISLMNR